MGVTNYMTVNGKIRSEQRSGEAHSRDYVLDRLGSVIQIYQNGWPIADACYEPYGGIYTQWNMEGKTFTWLGGWGYRQTGVEWSSVYVRARHYSRGLSNWTSIDPLWPAEMAYGYVEGRVMTGVDYWGNSIKYDKSCGRLDQKRIEDALYVGLGGPRQDVTNFLNCLNEIGEMQCRSGAVNDLGNGFISFWYALKNGGRDVLIRCADCEGRECGNTNYSHVKRMMVITLCTRALQGKCGPIKCVFAHELLHANTGYPNVIVHRGDNKSYFECITRLNGCEKYTANHAK